MVLKREIFLSFSCVKKTNYIPIKTILNFISQFHKIFFIYNLTKIIIKSNIKLYTNKNNFKFYFTI